MGPTAGCEGLQKEGSVPQLLQDLGGARKWKFWRSILVWLSQLYTPRDLLFPQETFDVPPGPDGKHPEGPVLLLMELKEKNLLVGGGRKARGLGGSRIHATVFARLHSSHHSISSGQDHDGGVLQGV